MRARNPTSSVTILCPTSGLGLRKDAEIISRALKENRIDCRIVYFGFDGHQGNFLQRLAARCKQKLEVTFGRLVVAAGFRGRRVSIHLEIAMHKHLFFSSMNVLIPNQEWCRINSLILDKIDCVWCKSRLAESVFAELGLPVRFVGFQTSIDTVPDLARLRKREFFTRIGMTRTRGAEELVDVWGRHPEWPTLNMVVDEAIQPVAAPGNVRYLRPFESKEDYQGCANGFLFHIYLTEAEGFGHSILESMSTGAIVLVTRAAPMTEYADDSSVIFVPAQYSGQLRLSPRFRSTDVQIEAAVNRALMLDEAEIQEMRKSAMAVNRRLEQLFVKSIGSAVKAALDV